MPAFKRRLGSFTDMEEEEEEEEGEGEGEGEGGEGGGSSLPARPSAAAGAVPLQPQGWRRRLQQEGEHLRQAVQEFVAAASAAAGRA